MAISRRRFLIVSSAAASAIPFRSLIAAGQTPATTPAVRFEAIRRNVGYFTGRGGTIGWLIDPDALIVVDTQFPDTANLCLEGLKERSSLPIDLVFNTHHHGDHTGGNGVFSGAARKIVAHARVPELLKQQQASQPEGTAAPVLPTATFDNTWSEAVGDERVTARHHGPAHTGGDAVIHFERAQVVHMGDLLFHERHPFIDRPAGASVQNWMTTIETVSKQMDRETIYIAGHAKEGRPVTVGRRELLWQRDYLEAALRYVQRGLRAGHSRTEIAAVRTLKGFEEYQESPPRLTLAATLGAAYDELTGK
jgi:cyclase